MTLFSSIEEAFAAALMHHQARRLTEAAAVYRVILHERPQHQEALHMLGVIACQTGRFDESVRLLGQAVEMKPTSVQTLFNLGMACRMGGMWAKSAVAFRRALALQPENPEISRMLTETAALASQHVSPQWKFRIADSGLRDKIGHFYNENLNFYEESQRLGFETSIFCHKLCDSDILKNIKAEPIFSGSIFDRLSVDPFMSEYDTFHALSDIFYKDFSCLKQDFVGNDNVFIFHTAMHSLIMGIARFFFRPNFDGPYIILFCGFEPGFDINEKGGIDIKSPSAIMYRQAFRAIPKEARRKLIVVSCTSELARKYSLLLGEAVPQLPFYRSLPMGFQVHPPQQKSRNSIEAMLYIGDARLDKGFPFVPMVARILLKEYPSLTLHVQINGYISDVRLRSAAEDLLQMAAETPRLRIYTGFFDQAVYFETINKVDLVIMTYHGRNYVSQESGVFAEVAALGKPVVVPAVGAMERRLLQGQVYGASFPEHTAEAIAQAASHVIRNLDDIAPKAFQAGAAWRSEHSIQGTFAQLLELLETRRA